MYTKAITKLLLAAFTLLGVACTGGSDIPKLQLLLRNPAAKPFNGVIEIPAEQITGWTSGQAVMATSGSEQLATQWSDCNGDGQFDALCLNVSLSSGEERRVHLYATGENSTGTNSPKLTQAELWHKTTGKFKNGKYIGGGNFSKFDSLRVPDGFTDHAYFIKYEGPGGSRIRWATVCTWIGAMPLMCLANVFQRRCCTMWAWMATKATTTCRIGAWMC